MTEPSGRRGAIGWATAHPIIVDVLLMVVFLWITAVQLLSIDAFHTELPIAAAALGTGVIAIACRRRLPIIAFGVVVAGAAASVTLPFVPLALLLIAAVVLHRGRRAGWIAAGAGLAVIAVVAVARDSAAATVLDAVALLTGVLVGGAEAARRERLETLVQLAQHLRIEQRQQAELAVTAERARIAREMHDVVAHGISVMTRLADGAHAAAENDSERARVVMGRVGDVGRDALADMRRVLGVLGDPTAAGSPQPTLADLSRLVQDHRDTGLAVQLKVAEDLPVVSDAAAATIYRIVQESLTNVARYAVGVRDVRVAVDRFRDGVVVAVTDDGRSGAEQSQGAGRGLVGMRERAAVYGGTVHAEPIEPHGWRVRATLLDTAPGTVSGKRSGEIR